MSDRLRRHLRRRPVRRRPQRRGGPYTAFTGNAPGLRLDTNGSIQIEKRNDDRKLLFDFGAGQACSGGWFDHLGFCADTSGADLRFEFGGGFGLDLCSLVPGGASGVVPLHAKFLDASGDPATLSYGCIDEPQGVLIGNALQAEVQRLDEWTWRIVGQTACLHDGGFYGAIVDGTDVGPLNMPFGLTLVDENAP